MDKKENPVDNYIKKRFDFWDFLLFMVLLTAYAIAIFLNFRQQALGIVESDMEAYIKEMLGENTKYPFSYPLYFKFGALIHLVVKSPEISMAVAATILCILSALLLRFFLGADEELQIAEFPFFTEPGKIQVYKETWMAEKEEKSSKAFIWLQGLWELLCRFLYRFGNTCFTFALLMVSMLFVPTGYRFPGVKFDYVGVFSPNPFHNATYNAARPFTIVVFFLFARILLHYEKEIRWKDFGLFSLFLFLATLTKPSFTLVFVSTAGLVMAGRLLWNRFRTFGATLLLGLMFVPTFGLLLYQFFGVFGPVEEGERGIGISLLKVWGQYCTNVPMAVTLAAAFPIVFFLLFAVHYFMDGKNKVFTMYDQAGNVRKTLVSSGRKATLRLSLEMFLVSLIEFIVFYEKGFRMVDANFSWGYMSGLFFLYVSTGKALLSDTVNHNRKVWQLLLMWMFFGAHLCCGIYYLLRILLGKSYY